MTSREKLAELLCNTPFVSVWPDIAIKIADYLIANDVVVRKRGEWKYIGDDEWCCSVCGYVASTEGRWEPMMDDFCRGCGSDMRKGKNG